MLFRSVPLRNISADYIDARVQSLCKVGSMLETNHAKLLSCVADELREIGRLDAVEAGGSTVDEATRHDWPEYHEERVVYDEMTGLPLNPELVHQARRVEVEYMNKTLKVYRPATKAEVAAANFKPIPTRWVDLDKGDKDNPNV